MYKYIESYEMGYEDGINDALNDYYSNSEKKFKIIEDIDILSKLYDVGYINAYNKFIKYINCSFNYEKNDV